MTKTERYLDAVRGLKALRRSVEDDGNPRAESIAIMKAAVRQAYGRLTGSEIGALRREEVK